MNSTTIPHFLWSDLARKSTAIGDALDQHGEVAVQRGTQSLRLGSAHTSDIEGVLQDMCRLLASLVSADQPSHVVHILERAWPWTRALPREDQLALAAEIGPVAELCESLGSYTQLLEVLADWRRTARAWAEGARPAAPGATGPTIAVRRPTA